MANEKKRLFGTDKSKLALSNEKGALCPKVGTKFNLTGRFTCEEGYEDRRTKERVHTDRVYCYFEGKRNGIEREDGISAGIFLRRPFDGFTEAEFGQLTAFAKSLTDCGNAEDLFNLLEKEGWNKTIVVKAIVRHTEVPYGKEQAQPVPYAVFDLE